MQHDVRSFYFSKIQFYTEGRPIKKNNTYFAVVSSLSRLIEIRKDNLPQPNIIVYNSELVIFVPQIILFIMQYIYLFEKWGLGVF